MTTDKQLLAEMVKDRLGIDMTDNVEGLTRKLSPRLDALKMGIWEYMRYVREHPSEWDAIIDCVTINETYFFREQEQLDAFVQSLKGWPKPQLRIWCAACSTGEEAYTLSMLAKDALSEGVEVDILATDINQDVLRTAKSGRYPAHSLSFRRMGADQIDRYFVKDGDHYRVKETYRQSVTFQPFNLVDEEGWLFKQNFDIIFCRNVLIYFDDTAIQEVLHRFHGALGEQGILFIGHSDPYRNVPSVFELIRTKDTVYLKKGGK